MILHLPLFCVFYDYNFRKGKANRFVFVETKMQKVAVSNIAKQIRGVSYKPVDLHNDLNKDSVILLRANNISDGKINFDDVVYVDKKKVSSEQYLQKGDILICASSGSKNLVGKAASVSFDIKCTFGAFCKVIRPISKYANYLGMYFQSDIYRRIISNVAIGANINNIRNEHIDSLELSIYSDDKNNEIVSLLDTLQSIITHRRTQLEKLDLLVKARFVEMFGDVINNTKRWKIYLFSEITISRLGKMLDKKSQTGKSKLPYLANFNVQWFQFKLDNLNMMDFNEKEQIEFSLEDDDLLVCEGGEIGRCAIWHNEITPCYFQKALHRVRCNKSIIIPIYLAWWFKFNCDNNGFSEIEGAKATIAHLPGAKLKKLPIAVPPLTLQNQFADFVKQVDQSKSILQQELDKVQMLFDSLMQEYFG